jgi:hypothetical protein
MNVDRINIANERVNTHIMEIGELYRRVYISY